MNDKIQQQKGTGIHQLIFEEAWDRTMAYSDRMKLKSIFEASSEVQKDEIRFLSYRVAYNHVGELLATVIIQNGSQDPLNMRDFTVLFEDAKGDVLEHSFSFPRLVVAGNSSTPWTFIFPKDVVRLHELDLTRWQISKRV